MVCIIAHFFRLFPCFFPVGFPLRTLFFKAGTTDILHDYEKWAKLPTEKIMYHVKLKLIILLFKSAAFIFYEAGTLKSAWQGNVYMKSTNELLDLLQNLDIEEFLKTYPFQDINISAYLNELLAKHNMQPKDVIIRLNMERSYTYQILNGRRRPTRNFLIRIAFLCMLSVDETQKLLTVGNRPILYPRNRFDAAVLYCLHHQLGEERLNQLLEDIGEETLN